LAADARLFPGERGEPAPMLSGEELAVDKLHALFGRAEARDFVDLMELEPRYGLERLSAALQPRRIAASAPRSSPTCSPGSARLGRREFDLDDDGYEQLRGDVVRWPERALGLARRREIERGRARDLGLER
jgi:hypothetical protein